MQTTPISPKRMRGEQGAALLEFAVVFPLFVFVLYGLITFGMMLSAKNSITHAAAEGARAAIGAPDDATAVTRATQAVAQSLNWMGSNYSPGTDLSVSSPSHANCTNNTSSTSKCITVQITYHWSTHPMVPPIPLLSNITPSSFKSTAVVETQA